LDRWFWEHALADKASAATLFIVCWVETALDQRARAVTPRLLILAAAPKWQVADVAQAAVPKSLLQPLMLVPEPALVSVVAKPVAVCSASVLQAAVLKSPELAIHVQGTTVVLLDQAAALKPALAVRLLFAAPQFWTVSRV